ncbi:hypothetical protein NKH18_31345 [Streptomyces sp. M10(2022)]
MPRTVVEKLRLSHDHVRDVATELGRDEFRFRDVLRIPLLRDVDEQGNLIGELPAGLLQPDTGRVLSGAIYIEIIA